MTQWLDAFPSPCDFGGMLNKSEGRIQKSEIVYVGIATLVTPPSDRDRAPQACSKQNSESGGLIGTVLRSGLRLVETG
jgi:hypothetical protein